jgi:hypothetical protein
MSKLERHFESDSDDIEEKIKKYIEGRKMAMQDKNE